MRAARAWAGVTTAALLGTGLASCEVGPIYQPPVVIEAPHSWGAEPRVPSRTVAAEGQVDLRWWKSFRDPELTSLVERLATQNLDLKTAAERVIQGVAQRQVTAAQGLPSVDGQATYQRVRDSATGVITLTEPAPGAPLEYNLFQAGLTSSWELDLFGRVRRAVEAADANTLASVESRHDVALAAIAELAQSTCSYGETRLGSESWSAMSGSRRRMRLWCRTASAMASRLR